MFCLRRPISVLLRVIVTELLMAMEEKQARAVAVKTDTDEFVLYGRPCELSAFSYIAPNRHLPKERTYFNVEKKVRSAVLNLINGQSSPTEVRLHQSQLTLTIS